MHANANSKSLSTTSFPVFLGVFLGWAPSTLSAKHLLTQSPSSLLKTRQYHDGLEVCSRCRSGLSQQPLHTRYCHLRSSASASCSDWHSTGSMCPDSNLLTYHLNLFHRNRHCYIFVKYIIIKNCDVHYKLQWKPWNGGLLRWYECETGPPCRWLGAGSAAACVMWVGCGWRWIALAGTSGFLWTGLGVDSVVSIYSRTVGL